jgi:hypothetical protein
VDFLSARKPTPGTLAQWKKASLAGSWRMPNDWDCTAADNVILAWTNEADLTEPVRLLAHHRALLGVGIDESLADLHALFDTLQRISLRQERALTRAFTAAWVEESSIYASTISCTDQASGLSTGPHFARRLHELYDDVAARPHEQHVLAIIHVVARQATRRSRSEFIALAGSRAKSLMTPVGAFMTFTGMDLQVVLPRQQRAYIQLRALREALETLSSFPDSVHMETEPLPRLQEDLSRLLTSFT